MSETFLFREPFFASDWLQAVGLFASDQFTLGREKSYATVRAYIEDFDKLKSCIEYLMGYNRVGGTTGRDVVRQAPAVHPIFSAMRVKEILDLKGIQFDGKEEQINISDRSFDYARYRRFRIEVSYTQLDFNSFNTDHRSQ